MTAASITSYGFINNHFNNDVQSTTVDLTYNVTFITDYIE